MRRLLAPLLASGLVLTLSGCFVISGTSSLQATHAAPVKLSTTMCVSGSASCNDGGNSSMSDPAGDDDAEVQIQALYAVRLPVGTTAPDSFPSTPGGGRVATTFARNAGYEAELQKYEPAPAGERWHGYLSQTFTYDDDPGTPASVLAEITVPLPRPAEGPFVTPLKWRPVSGSRQVGAGALAADRPVVCSNANDPDDFFGGWSETNMVGITIVCADSPSPAATRGFLTASTRDFGVTGTRARITAGGGGTVAFLATWSGAAEAGQTYALTAAGGPPGATLTIDRTSVTPGPESSTPVLVDVDVPAGTAPGVYPLTVSAARAGKDTRIGTSAVTVLAAPSAPVAPSPAPTPTPGTIPTPGPDRAPVLSATSLSPVKPRRSRTATLRLTLSEPATVTATVERRRTGRRVGSTCSLTARKGKRCTRFVRVGSVTRPLAAGARTLTLPAKLAGKALAIGSHRLRLVAVDAAGNRSAARTVTFSVVR